MFCYSCGTEVKLEKQPGRQATCPKCSSYLHCCLNCQFYDVNAHHQCREPQAEFVPDKAMGNFCEYFQATLSPERIKTTDRAAEARRKLDELFKKK